MSTIEDAYKRFDNIQSDENGCRHLPSRNTTGYYRRIKINGIQFMAHRIALERKLGRPIKPGYQALHTCDRKSCVNPDHLYEGTPENNIHDLQQRNPKAFEWDKSQAAITRWMDPKYRQKRKQAMKEKWKDPEYYAKMQDARRKPK
jgi:hypothetical protein